MRRPFSRRWSRSIVIIGVPKEVKNRESRVAATPSGVSEFAARGHVVLVEHEAGVGSGFSDHEYERAGARIVNTHEEVFARSAMIVKVKEPVADEYPLLRAGQILFTYLHLAADEPLTLELMKRRVQ